MSGMPQQRPARDGASRRPRPDASMSLLTNVVEHSLDDGYAEAAARRRKETGSGGRLPSPLRARLGLAAGLVLAGLVVTLGAAEARVSAPVVAKERQELIDRIETGTAEADQLHDDVEELGDDVEARRAKALDTHGNGRSGTTGLLAGSTPVTGPGIKLVVDDAKDADGGEGGGPRESGGFSDTGRVRDRDIQRVVNGLWEAGAEAVSINGQRLTALSAIRAAGDAILVDNKPLAPPYTLLAIGEGAELSDAFQNTTDGQYLYVLQENYGVRTSISPQEEVSLPGAQGLTVRNAQPAQQPAEHSGKGTS
ncbi:DUF881 domain-containing protein [Streptomyces sp. A7024]|uniref:DUF881 domain-containing protein n=1 Tax=Streptomyces coryli TaxID=1128680 RepID=A0A6G4TSE7_9ACTN|nr:DUF881 domain-containing protein [Streptomyces coryli]NGN62915.1 DUF881 domain-containing protein [Streptomyces coryli]